ncbi:MAG: cupin [Flavobacteriales bacterium]|mgnify:CR=1 FL=1|nr:cupin [Flavobacteriales bacterium]|tara:strand:- start:18566 stop:19057 length:492 start_codon:yes stop_codon:yes gene_type:complete
MESAEYWIKHLKLKPHPEGGFYKEVYRSKEVFFPTGISGERNYMTSIYFLLDEGSVSHFHSIQSDELWCYHSGDALSVYLLYPDGKLDEFVIGPNSQNGEILQAVVPANTIFGSKSKGNYSLVGCVVSPGFDFRDFTLYTTKELLNNYPQHEGIIKQLSKAEY